MSDFKWENLKEIFHAALELPPNDRASYLEQVTDGDLGLRHAVESLLKSHEETDNFIDKPAYQAAAEMLVDGAEFKPGQVVDHYEIVSLLGEGGMGRVYLADDTKLHRRVSLKFLSAKFVKDHERLRRFEQEARATSALNHPNILTIHGISEVDGRSFIATEFIEGQTLRDRLRARFDLNDAIEVASQVASALVAAHRVNIVHRDIKPENIMIRRDDGLVKVLDFGLAKVAAPRVTAKSLDEDNKPSFRENTAPGVVMGTVAYMSPEQARGDAVDERTDIWSLGVVLYEMIVGCTPFVAATSNEIISGILSQTPPPALTRYLQAVPEGLVNIVGKALAKHPDQRYQTSKDLLTDLKRLKQTLEQGAGEERQTGSEKPAVHSAETNLKSSKLVMDEKTAGRPSVSSAEYLVNQVSSHKRGVALVSGIVLIAVTAAVLLYSRARPQAVAHAHSEIKSLAVLPLKSLDSGENFLGVGIADAVIRRISQNGGVTVRPTSAVLKYIKEDTDSLAVARQLNADAILEGTVQRAGDRLRVTVNLLRTSDGVSLWADSFDLTTADIFAIQDKVAQQVASRLQLHLDPTQQSQLNNKYPTDPRAYEAYIKGIFSLDERGYGEGSLPKMEITIDFFKQAIEIDPKYALAHAQLAFAYVWTAIFIEPENTKWADLAREEIARAHDLNPNLAETHLAHAVLLWSAYEGYQNAEAIRELLLAKQLNPNSSSPDLAALYGHVGLDDLAARELKRDLEINPTSQSLRDLTVILPYLAGSADDWLSARRQVYPTADRHIPWYFLRKGNLEEAQKALDQLLPDNPGNKDLLMQKALLLALRGDFRDAESRAAEILAAEQRNDQQRHHRTYDAACIYGLAGHSSDAVKWLKETSASGFPDYPLFLHEPFLDRIRQTSEFIQFMSDQKVQWEKYRQEFGGLDPQKTNAN